MEREEDLIDDADPDEREAAELAEEDAADDAEIERQIDETM